jgi:ATP-dependent DNA helicase PIF1
MDNGITLTSCQERAFSALQGADNVFVTGGAGSGKSFLVRYFLRGKDTKEFPVLASTGAAAVLVGGRTFHSFFGLGIMEGGIEATVEKAARNRQVVRRLKKINGFIVDEVSMLSGPTLRAAELIARRVRDSELPWGGLRVVAVGDFAQLPPVERSTSATRGWAFLDSVWSWSGFQTCFLRTQTRCRDEDYMRILASIREGVVTADVKAYLDAKTSKPAADFDGTRLFPRRDETERFNLSRLENLRAPAQRFETIYSGDSKSVETLKKYAPVPESLILKEGALVMLRQNDPQGRWVNGSTGHIQKIHPGRLQITLLNGRNIDIEKASFSLMSAEGETVAAAVNYPVTLAWASTIHKAQGATLDRMAVNLSQLWEPGQAYVALSRLTSGHELCIESWEARSIRVDPNVVQFYSDLN